MLRSLSPAPSAAGQAGTGQFLTAQERDAEVARRALIQVVAMADRFGPAYAIDQVRAQLKQPPRPPPPRAPDTEPASPPAARQPPRGPPP